MHTFNACSPGSYCLCLYGYSDVVVTPRIGPGKSGDMGVHLLRDKNIINRASKIVKQKRQNEIIHVAKSNFIQINFLETLHSIEAKYNLSSFRQFVAMKYER